MKIFTLGNGTVKLGAKVSIVGSFEIFAICVGQTGLGLKRGYIPVSGVDNTIKVTNVVINQTRIGNPKFMAITPETDKDTDECIIVFRHTSGYNGGAEVTGDRVDLDKNNQFREFPGKILTDGLTTLGNSQYITKLKKGDVFRIKRWGEYGNLSEHYGCFDGDKVNLVTCEEREGGYNKREEI
jgi:hypothetical protein